MSDPYNDVEKYVSQQQERITDNPVGVIQAIQAQGRTGELRVRRSDDVQKDVCFVLFIQGQIVSAQFGSYKGPAALNMLRNWKRCVFVFLPHSSPFLPLQSSPSQSSPQQSSPSQVTPYELEAFLPQKITSPLPNHDKYTQPSGSFISPAAVPRATMSVVKALGAIERAGLSRAHRQVMLLIDGRKSVSELTNAAKCTPEEMNLILQTMVRLLIIRIS